MTGRAGVAVLAAFLAASEPALAAPGGALDFTLDAVVGVVSGTATELVFDYPLGTEYKRSELIWDLKGVAVAGIESSLGLGRRVRINLGLWSALSEGSGGMIDRDWRYSDAWTPYFVPDDENWTDESRHPDTTVDQGTRFDLSLSLLALESGPFALTGILGYRSESWIWSSRGGTYIYSEEGLRDTAGSFEDGETVITYEQQYAIPYAGVSLVWAVPGFRVNGRLLLSPAVSASDTDYHALRDTYFEGEFAGGSCVVLAAGAAWEFAPGWSARIGVEYLSLSEITGDVTQSGAEGYAVYGSGGGIALETTTVSAGAGYRF